jgi:hypothetical protein
LPFAYLQVDCCVEEFAIINCPFCGRSFEVAVDASVRQQCFTTDCEVCCRPLEVRAECDAGRIVSVNVTG